MGYDSGMAEGPLRLVLDTSVLTNPDTRGQFGESVAQALEGLLACARPLTSRLELFMPPSIRAELETFIPDEAMPADFELVVSLRAPNRYGVVVPGFLLYELIEDIRARIDRGLRVAERAVRETHADVDAAVKRLRERYREALRSGLLDSREDVDVILLASEIGGAISSSDAAVTTWAEKLGIRLIEPKHLRRTLESA